MGSQRTAARESAAARRLPARLQGIGQGALAEGRSGEQAGRSDSARRVRRLGNRDLGFRPGILKAKSADAARPQRRRGGFAELLERRQGAIRSRQDHRADAAASCRMGRRPSELSGARLFRTAEEYAVQTADRIVRRHAYGDAGEEPHAVLPRADGLPRRGKAARPEITIWWRKNYSRRSATVSTTWSAPFFRISVARGRVGRMLSSRLARLVRSQIAAAVAVASWSESSA